jgi:hypothetical protein
MTKWTKDDGYCGCETAYFGETAVVICPPELSDDGWGYQVFDESNEEAVERGEYEHAGYGFRSEAAVKRFVERCYA